MDRLQGLAPTCATYATLPIAEAFTWSAHAADLGDGSWYLVAFRSVRRDGCDEARLAEYDELAHQEAAASPGFVHYFKGPAAFDGGCMSFCLWQSRDEARAAARQPAHARAVSLLDEMYATYTLEFFHVSREAGGPLTFEPYRPPAHLVGEDPAAVPPAGLVPDLAIRPALA
jgi:hypothetical protein